MKWIYILFIISHMNTVNQAHFVPIDNRTNISVQVAKRPHYFNKQSSRITTIHPHTKQRCNLEKGMLYCRTSKRPKLIRQYTERNAQTIQLRSDPEHKELYITQMPSHTTHRHPVGNM